MNQDVMIYSLDELAQRNGRILPDIWVGYKGLIYDVTSSELFKNGKHYFHDAGKDLTIEMIDAPHMDDVMNRFPVVGRLILEKSQLNIEQLNLKENAKRLVFIEKHQVSSDIYRFFFECPIDSLSNEYVGQYITFLLTLNGIEYKRSYSIASIYGNIVEFLIQLKPQGVVSNYLVYHLQKNNTIYFNGPFGGVQKSVIKTSNLKLICTDVGIAPIRQIIHYLVEENLLEKKIELIYGAHKLSELVYHEEWALLTKIHANFSYLPYTTQQTNIFCSVGYFTNESNFIATISEYLYIVVGWERMVSKTKEILKHKGIDNSFLHVQKYI
ncbi:MAG: hypothetical protein KA264_01855 [Crocinitomicaceae bacterium]|nr:hypothetical protein [Crocinitomicaceae bacterium]